MAKRRGERLRLCACGCGKKADVWMKVEMGFSNGSSGREVEQHWATAWAKLGLRPLLKSTPRRLKLPRAPQA